ncbi:MAG: hypothetical protein ABWX92_02890 [Mycetocola sp.]
MAEYNGNGRTNYFRVKDISALKAELLEYGIETATMAEARMGAEFVLHEATGKDKPAGSIALFSYGTWPQLDDESVAQRLEIDDEDTPVPNKHASLAQLVASHLLEGEVAVFIEVGFEKMRYLGGHATAVDSTGDLRSIDLDDIYGLAAAELSTNGQPITMAHY